MNSMNKQPADEQIKEFWEWCGFEYKETDRKYALLYNGEIIYFWWKSDYTACPNLPIDLNNLFKYAVPKLRDLSEDNALQDIEFHWQGINISDIVECNLIFDEAQFDGEGKDPALALFWAIYELIKEVK